jgi:hypothetical protein
MPVVGAIAAVGSIGLGAYSASQAAGISGQAQGQSAAVFGEQQYYAQQLQQLIANPSSVTNLPGYQFQFDQGAKAVTDQAAAMGYLGSGNLGVALTQYGQNYAQSAYQQQEQMLAQLSGLTAPSSPAQYLNAATAAQQSANSQFSSLTNAAMYYAMMGGGNNPWGSPYSTSANGPWSSTPGVPDSAGTQSTYPGGP